MRELTAVMLFVLVSATSAAAQDSSDPADPQQPGTPSAPGLFRKLFTTLARDVTRLPSKDSAGLLINGSMFALAAHPFDEAATLGASSSELLKASFAGWGKALGREWVQGGGALAAYVAGRVFDQPGLASVGGDLIEAQLLSVTLTQGVKFATQRTRPDGEARSFPSGHASAAFATATVLHRHYGRKVAIPAYAVAAYTSASRLQANSHYMSDVIVGATLGIMVGRTATMELPRARIDVAPAPVPGGIFLLASARLTRPK